MDVVVLKRSSDLQVKVEANPNWDWHDFEVQNVASYTVPPRLLVVFENQTSTSNAGKLVKPCPGY
jgi:hypothetical protein